MYKRQTKNLQTSSFIYNWTYFLAKITNSTKICIIPNQGQG